VREFFSKTKLASKVMIPEENVQFDRAKFKDVVHYICAKCPVDELGKVKLHKILYFADMLHFIGTGAPLTGVQYQKQKFGPMARHLGWAIDALVRENRLRVEKRDYFGFDKMDYHALGDVDSSRLDENSRRVLDEVIEFVRSRSAKAISELSHSAAWEAVGIGDIILYFTAFGLYPAAVTDEDVDAAIAQARKIRPLIEAERASQVL
jgi:uncharacterized phage-associated protein